MGNLRVTAWLALILLNACAGLAEETQCAVDERRNIAFKDVTGESVILRQYSDKQSPDDCYSACCQLVSTENCTSASFYAKDDEYVCVLMKCQPFDQCIWENKPYGYSARIGLVDSAQLANLSFENGGGVEETKPGTGPEATRTPNSASDTFSQVSGQDMTSSERSSTLLALLAQNITVEGATESINASHADNTVTLTSVDWMEEEEKIEQEIEQEVDAIFNGDDKWNIEFQSTTTELWPADDDSYDWGDWGDAEDDDDYENNNAPGGGEGTGGGVVHSGDGVYGAPVGLEYDYGMSPTAVFGLIVFVLLVLVALMVIGRKVTQAQRLQYRPLNDNLRPSPTDYDADDWDEVNTHLVKSG